MPLINRSNQAPSRVKGNEVDSSMEVPSAEQIVATSAPDTPLEASVSPSPALPPSQGAVGALRAFFVGRRAGFAFFLAVWAWLLFALTVSSAITVRWKAGEVSFFVFFLIMLTLGGGMYQSVMFRNFAKMLITGTAIYTLTAVPINLFVSDPGIVLHYLFSGYVFFLLLFSVFLGLRGFGYRIAKDTQ